MKEPGTTFFSLQALRAGAALLVVLFHLRIVEDRFGDGAPLLPGAVRFADGGVDLFFVISGFVMATIMPGHFRSAPAAGHFLARRIWRVVPLYWVYTTVVLILMALLPGLVNSSYEGQSVWASYLLWPQPQLPLLTVGWTLIHEMYFYLVMTVALLLLSERLFPWFLLAWASLVAAAQASPLSGPPWLQVLLNAMTLEFIAGAMLGLYWKRLPPRVGTWCLRLGIMAFAIALFLLDSMPGVGDATKPLHPLLRVVAFGPASALLVLGAVSWEAARTRSLPAPLIAIGDSSYSLYLSHVFVLTALGWMWRYSGLTQGPGYHAGFIAMAVALSILIGRTSYRLLERPLLRSVRLPRDARVETAPSP